MTLTAGRTGADAASPASASQSLVLVVDDDEALRLVLQTSLARAGFEVVTAADGDAALNAVAERPPDVIVLDSQMPGLDGLGFARAYRSTPPPHAPIVAASARDDVHLFAALVGASAVVPKPFTPAAMVDAVRRVTPLSEFAERAD